MRSFFREGAWQIKMLVTGLLVVLILVFTILATRADSETTSIWLTKTDLQPGQVITTDSLRMASVPTNLVPDKAASADTHFEGVPVSRLIPRNTILGDNDLLGSVATRGLLADEAILKVRLPGLTEHSISVDDIIELWGIPLNCSSGESEIDGCSLEVLASKTRVAEVSESTAGWGGEQGAEISVVIKENEIGKVLQAEANGSLTPVIRPPTT